jgi:uncharacterized protein
MNLSDLIFLLLYYYDKTLECKTKLQKLFYFLSIKMDKNFGYEPHFYGPYSYEVENALSDLVSLKFVSMKSKKLGENIERGFEIKQYNYIINENCKELAKYLERKYLDSSNKIKAFVDNIKEIGDPDYFNLSIAAKAYFILKKENKPLSQVDIINIASQFNWKIKENDLQKSAEILKGLHLIN